ncbi:MAG: Ribosomal RNA small subunit methyltransferase E [Holosporales bacterium]
MRVRLFSPQEIVFPFTLGVEQSHYCMHVLRLNVGDKIQLFNAVQGGYEAVIKNIHKKGIVVDDGVLIKALQHFKKCALAFSPIKQDRLNFMIEKATELGVSDFYPILCDYTQVHKINADRLLKIAIEAAEQSERMDIPTIHQMMKLRDFLQHAQDLKLTFAAALERTDYRLTVQSIDGVIIGPEGGFSMTEKNLLVAQCVPISLGDTILRAETAAIVGIDRIRV